MINGLKNNLVPAMLLLVLITLLGYKFYVLRVESKFREMAVKIVSVHASYNEFMRGNRLSSNYVLNEIKYSDINLHNGFEVIDAENIDDLPKFWNEFFHTITAPDSLRKFESGEEKPFDDVSLDKYSRNLNLIFWANDINQAPYKLTLGILIKGRYGVRLDKLIDDGSPASGHMKLQRILDKSKISQRNDKCARTNLKKPTSKDLVDCNYVYLF